MWKQITCQEREALIDRVGRFYNGPADPYGPTNSLTDMSGEFGEPKVFTEWGHRETGEPLLRDCRWPESDRPCEHHEWVSAVNETDR